MYPTRAEVNTNLGTYNLTTKEFIINDIATL
jgi:hypothetical protein